MEKFTLTHDHINFGDITTYDHCIKGAAYNAKDIGATMQFTITNLNTNEKQYITAYDDGNVINSVTGELLGEFTD